MARATSNHPSVSDAVVMGIARTGPRTKELIKRIQPGEIAVIDHVDLDRVATEGLVEAGVGAIVNAGPSVSGRYPNLGPMLAAVAGIPIVDNAGADTLAAIPDGSLVRIDGGDIYVEGRLAVTGTVQTVESLDALVESAKATIGDELARFAENTLEYMRDEQHLLLESPVVPDTAVSMKGRHALVVVRGDQFREDLAALAGYVREIRPVIIAVDGGADAVLATGHRPDIIVGDFDSVSTEALHCGAELMVHAYPDGRAPGAARLDEAGVSYVLFPLAGTSEDIAMLLAYEKGAELIVAVGTHVSLADFLDKGRPGMASTFLTRLKVGPILVDAKGVNKLYQAKVRKRDLTLLVAAAMLVLVIVLAFSPPFHLFWDSARIAWREVAAMINFRFHLVSLVSVFLALAIGIATGASVVNQGLVKSQKSQLERLDTRLRDRGSEIAAIEGERDRSLRFADEGESRFVAGRLTSTPIVVVQVDGIDEAPIRALVATLRDSGASVAAVLTLTGRSLLGTPADTEAARLALGASSSRPDTLRFLLRERLRDALLDPDKAPTLETLRAGGFVSFDGLDSSTSSPALPTGARVVMASGAGAKIDSDSVLRLLQTLTAAGPKRVVAVEAVDTKSNQRADAVFVPLVRDDISLRDRMSSVDDVDRLEGRVATVYALEDLREQVTGRYGTDKTAQRLLPAAASPPAP